MSASLQLVPGHFSQANPIVHSKTVLGKARKAFPALRFVPVENMARSPDETQITPSQLEMGRSVRRDQNFAYRLGQDRKRNFQSGDAARTATSDRVTIDGGIKEQKFPTPWARPVLVGTLVLVPSRQAPDETETTLPSNVQRILKALEVERLLFRYKVSCQYPERLPWTRKLQPASRVVLHTPRQSMPNRER